MLRIGVNTGEVVAGEATAGHTLVTGDAVNVAARTEQAADPGQVLLGGTTHRLVRSLVEAEPVPPLEPRARPTRLRASVDQRRRSGAHPPARHAAGGSHPRTSMSWRRPSTGQMEEQACYLFTLLGTAGVGKSRLVHEFRWPDA